MKHHRYHRAAAVYHIRFSIAQRTLCVPNFSQPPRFANAIALSACCHQLCLAPFAPSSHFSLFLSPLGFQPFPPVPAIPSPCPTLTFSKPDLTNLSHQPGNPTLPRRTVKVVLVFLLTPPLPTAVAPKILAGMVMVVVMLHDARAAAGALLGERRNEAGEWIACRHIPPRLYRRFSRGGSPGGQNPGNNLHVSGLSHRVDSRDLENHFAAIGRVRIVSSVWKFATDTTDRSKRLKSCGIPTPRSHADSVS